MSVFVNFVNRKDVNLFSTICDVVPRIGEEVYREVSIWNAEEKVWDKKALADERAYHDTHWRVVKVYHNLRRTGIDSQHHSVWVTLEKIRAASTSGAQRG